MWLVAVLGIGLVTWRWLTARSGESRLQLELERRAAREVLALRCDLDASVREARRWFELDLPAPAWDAISDAFALLEALRPRVADAEWRALQAGLLAAIPRALDARPRPARRTRDRRPRRRSHGLRAS